MLERKTLFLSLMAHLNENFRCLRTSVASLLHHCCTIAQLQAHHAIHDYLCVGTKACKPLLKIAVVKAPKIRVDTELICANRRPSFLRFRLSSAKFH